MALLCDLYYAVFLKRLMSLMFYFQGQQTKKEYLLAKIIMCD